MRRKSTIKWDDDDPAPVRKCTKVRPRPGHRYMFAHPVKQIAEINYGYHAYKCPHCGQEWEECYIGDEEGAY